MVGREDRRLKSGSGKNVPFGSRLQRGSWGRVRLGLWDRWTREDCYSEERWLRDRVIESVGKDASR